METKLKEFNEKLKALLDEYNLALVAEPFIQEGRIGAIPRVMVKPEAELPEVSEEESVEQDEDNN